jgi:hypothetical protein
LIRARQEQVGRFEVAVDNPTRVDVIECAEELHHPLPDDLLLEEYAVAPLLLLLNDPLLKRATICKLENEIHVAGMEERTKIRRNVSMVQHAQHGRFPLSIGTLTLREEAYWHVDSLQRHFAPIPFVLRQVNNRKGPFA